MNNQISLEQIKKFKEVYDSDKMNKVIENAITKNGVEKACISRDVIIENQPVFNIYSYNLIFSFFFPNLGKLLASLRLESKTFSKVSLQSLKV